MSSLSAEEQLFFDCLKDYLDTYQYSPSLKDIQATLALGRSRLQKIQKSLQQKGYIDWQPKRARTYQILRRGVPVLGMIQAGYVVDHPSDLQEWVDCPGMAYRSQDYALRVCGDSMIDAHICEGDLVLMRPNPDLGSVKQGTIAAVWVEGEGATLKHVEVHGHEVLLKPANAIYPIRRLNVEAVQIQGILVSSHRYYSW